MTRPLSKPVAPRIIHRTPDFIIESLSKHKNGHSLPQLSYLYNTSISIVLWSYWIMYYTQLLHLRSKNLVRLFPFFFRWKRGSEKLSPSAMVNKLQRRAQHWYMKYSSVPPISPDFMIISYMLRIVIEIESRQQDWSLVPIVNAPK